MQSCIHVHMRMQSKHSSPSHAALANLCMDKSAHLLIPPRPWIVDVGSGACSVSCAVSYLNQISFPSFQYRAKCKVINTIYHIFQNISHVFLLSETCCDFYSKLTYAKHAQSAE